MLTGISITCFAASYAVAWSMEAARLFLRSGIRRAVMLAFTTAGLAAHTLFLVHRGSNATQSPLSSWYDWYLVAAWSLAAMYLYLTLWRPQNPIGLFVLPCVLVLIGVASLNATQEPFPAAEAARHWGMAHGIALLAGSVAVLAGFVFGVMSLLQAWRLKHKRLARPGLRLPSLEWLQRMNERMIVASVFLLTLGFLAGVVSNRINHTIVPWSDPVVWSSSILVGWMLIATIFQAVYKPARTGRKVAYLTVFSFMFLLITLAILKFTNTSHGSRPRLPDGAWQQSFQPVDRPVQVRAGAPGVGAKRSPPQSCCDGLPWIANSAGGSRCSTPGTRAQSIEPRGLSPRKAQSLAHRSAGRLSALIVDGRALCGDQPRGSGANGGRP